MNDERWQHLFRNYADSSFVELLRRDTPHLMPSSTTGGEAAQSVLIRKP